MAANATALGAGFSPEGMRIVLPYVLIGAELLVIAVATLYRHAARIGARRALKRAVLRAMPLALILLGAHQALGSRGSRPQSVRRSISRKLTEESPKHFVESDTV